MKYFVVFLLLVSITTNAQPKLKWSKNYGGTKNENALSVLPLQGGDIMIAGYAESDDFDVNANKGDEDVWLIRIDSVGNIKWEKNFGGTRKDVLRGAILTSSNEILAYGRTSSSDGDVSVNKGQWDIWVVKFDTSGTIIWETTIGGNWDEDSYSAIELPNGEFVVGGMNGSNTGDFPAKSGIADVGIVRLSSSGQIIKTYSLGGTGVDQLRDLIYSSDGNIVFTARTESNDGDVIGYHDDGDIWVVKMDTSGSILWSKCLGGDYYDGDGNIIQTQDGGYVVAGLTRSNNGDVTYNDDTLKNNIWIVRLSSTGSIIADTTYGGSDREFEPNIIQRTENEYLIKCYSASKDGDITAPIDTAQADYDVWIFSIDSLGNINWDMSFGGSAHDYSSISDITFVNNNDILFVGGSESSNIHMPGNNGSYDIFIGAVCLPIDTAYEYDSNKNTYTALTNDAIYQWFDCANNQPIAGANTATFTPTKSGDYKLVISTDCFTDTSACFAATVSVGVLERGINNFSIYPNPALNTLNVVFAKGSMNAHNFIEIHDMSGRLMLIKALHSSNSIIDISHLVNGTYLCNIVDDENQTVGYKVIVKQ